MHSSFVPCNALFFLFFFRIALPYLAEFQGGVCNGYKKYSDYFIEIPAKICISPVYCLVMRGSIAPSAGTWKSTYMTATRVLLVVL